ncbi:hypothetical protein LINGRAHAP2_LOCUS29648 [Linum grandiflorum]
MQRTSKQPSSSQVSSHDACIC